MSLDPQCGLHATDGHMDPLPARFARERGWPSALRVCCTLLTTAICLSPSFAAGQSTPNATGIPGSGPEAAPAPAAAPSTEAAKEAPKKREEQAKKEPPSVPESGFFFGSNGRAVAGTNPDLSAPRDADIVRWGSRLDETTYLQMDVQRQDYWPSTGATTRGVVLLAVQGPIFHYNNDWNIRMAVRNLFVEERDLGEKGLSVWIGSRMYRGDYSDLLDFWPLDWLNTVGGGVRYELPSKLTYFAVHGGVNQPNTRFFFQAVDREPSLNRPGMTPVNILDRQRILSSFKVSHTIPTGPKSSVKGVLYGEAHATPSGEREKDEETPGVNEDLPADSGYVVGVQLSAYTEKNKNHMHLFVRYAGGMAAFGELGTPSQLGPDGTSAGARDLRVTWSGNLETGPLGLMVAGYVRSFRNASPEFDDDDLDEGIVMARPHFYIRDWVGVAAEASYQAQQRGGVPPPADPVGEPSSPAESSHRASVVRFGLMPFLNAAGKGDLLRPQFRLIWLATRRDEGAKALYPRDDVFSRRNWEHFIGLAVEWDTKTKTAF